MRAEIPQLRLLATATMCALLCAAPARAQELDVDASPDADAVEQPQPPADRENPFDRRPRCASMFLKTDWQLTSRQRSCDWIQNRMFSMSAFTGAAWSAASSMVLDSESEEGHSFATRFGHKFAQNAFKSTAGYLGGMVFREDPRTRPPYLVMIRTPRPKGFLRRTGHAMSGNVMAYRCVAPCTEPEHIKRVFALSRITGSLASGAASELWEPGREISYSRAWRGAASAYGSTFVNALFVEFKPELSAFANKSFRVVFGGR